MKRSAVNVVTSPIAARGGRVGRDLGHHMGRSRPAADGKGARLAGPEIWSAFWQDFSPKDQPQERCHVPGDGQSVVDRHWAEFADGLAAQAQVIDLGCGAGILGRILLGRRSDLSVRGVDWAAVPAIPVPKLTIHPHVRMEDLPFADESFDAAISLFGIEYGNIASIARELRRVLKPGAAYSFLVHHAESEIRREGGARRQALQTILTGKMKALFLASDMRGLEQQRRLLKEQFPAEPLIDLVGDHLRRNIFRTRVEREAMWQELVNGLGPEISLLMHLEQSAKSSVELGAWLSSLLSTMRTVSVSPLRRGSGQPIAWNVSGLR